MEEWNREERLRRMGRGNPDNMMCFLVQTAISTASVLAEIRVRLAAIEARLDTSAAWQGAKEAIKLIAPWGGVILMLMLWAIGKADISDVQRAITTPSSGGIGH